MSVVEPAGAGVAVTWGTLTPAPDRTPGGRARAAQPGAGRPTDAGDEDALDGALGTAYWTPAIRRLIGLAATSTTAPVTTAARPTHQKNPLSSAGS